MAGPVTDDSDERAYRRAADPAGTRPKVDPADVVPGDVAPLLTGAEADADAVEIDDEGREIPTDAAAGPGAAGTLVAAATAPPVPIGALEVVRPQSGGLVRPVTGDSRHAPRFQFILGGLLALGLSALVLVFAVFHGNRDALPAKWSTWHPTSGGFAGAAQIAARVGSEYRLPTGQPMVTVTGGQPEYAGIPASLAISSGSGTASNVLVVTGSTVLYKMCGGKPNCQILGTPSAKRLLLVRREALELALYTFRYLGADDVLIELPPVFTRVRAANGTLKTQIRHNAAFFTAQQLSPVLSRPLGTTLTPATPGVDTISGSPDIAAVEALTSRAFVGLSVRQSSQDGTLYFVLQPLTVS